MSILGPPDLPVVLKIPSDPLKFEILCTFGHPVVMVELTEEQLEQAIRVTGDFIATYFPFEEKYAYFNTQPLVSEYPLPADAYWVKDIKWDPAVTRIGDIFGAESFLFSFGGGSILLTSEGKMTCEECYEKRNKIKLITPFGLRRPLMRWNDRKQPMLILKTEKDFLICTSNHPISCDGKMKMACECKIGEKLINSNDKQEKIIDISKSETKGTWSVKVNGGGIYISAIGRSFYLTK
jgi:hypothetical protein